MDHGVELHDEPRHQVDMLARCVRTTARFTDVVARWIRGQPHWEPRRLDRPQRLDGLEALPRDRLSGTRVASRDGYPVLAVHSGFRIAHITALCIAEGYR